MRRPKDTARNSYIESCSSDASGPPRRRHERDRKSQSRKRSHREDLPESSPEGHQIQLIDEEAWEHVRAPSRESSERERDPMPVNTSAYQHNSQDLLDNPWDDRNAYCNRREDDSDRESVSPPPEYRRQNDSLPPARVAMEQRPAEGLSSVVKAGIGIGAAIGAAALVGLGMFIENTRQETKRQEADKRNKDRGEERLHHNN